MMTATNHITEATRIFDRAVTKGHIEGFLIAYAVALVAAVMLFV